jgi:hypothetical protein
MTRIRFVAAFGALALVVLVLTGSPTPAAAQQFLLDHPTRAGELTVFPDLNDPTVYYYVVDKPHLATGPDGKPKFSFLRYVENVRSGADQPEAREGEGGGIVHAVVSLSVTKEQIAEAQRELQRQKAGARIQGPVIFKSGKFGLVSSFKDTQGNLTKQCVGLGTAPLLDNEQAAVSIQLTKLGAKILWESFQTAAPDISFSFEMEMTGFRSPHRALIEANFDQIYEHKAFNAAVASTYLAAEIKTAFDDLRRDGSIKLTLVGSDEKLEPLILTAYNKISEIMFAPMGGTGTPSLASLGEIGGGGTSLLDRATANLNKAQAEAKAENKQIRAENEKRRAEAKADARADRAEAAVDAMLASNNGGGGDDAEPFDDADVTKPTAKDSADAVAEAETAGPRDMRGGGTKARVGTRAKARPADRGLAKRLKEVDGADNVPGLKEEVAVPKFSVVAAFEMKTVRQRGTFKIDLNKFTTDNLTLRFDENIGDLRSLMSDGSHFRQVNLDDPLYKQREIVVFVDGFNAGDFGQFVNFASVKLRKKHGSGEESQDEVRIDRKNFSAEGNAFKLLYGWKGDTDRRRWMDYEFQPTWSFFGGKTVELPWQNASAGAIGLAPPFQRRIVDLQADPDAIAKAEVRSITVKIFYDLGSGEQVKQVTLNATKSQLSDKVEFLLPAGKVDYSYEITWRKKGDKTVSSGRKSSSDTVLFVDEVPNG